MGEIMRESQREHLAKTATGTAQSARLARANVLEDSELGFCHLRIPTHAMIIPPPTHGFRGSRRKLDKQE